jgi:hypothetical protein
LALLLGVRHSNGPDRMTVLTSAASIGTLKVVPTMAAGVSDHLWSMEDLSR